MPGKKNRPALTLVVFAGWTILLLISTRPTFAWIRHHNGSGGDAWGHDVVAGRAPSLAGA